MNKLIQWLSVFWIFLVLPSQADITAVRSEFRIVNSFELPNGVPDILGDLMFSPDGNTVYIVANAENSEASIYTAAVTRDTFGNVSSFGVFSLHFSDPYIDTGLTYAPNSDTLFYRTDESPHYIVQRTSIGFLEQKEIINYNASYGGIAFIPQGYSNAGDLLSVSNSDDQLWIHPVVDDLDVTFTIAAATLVSDFTNVGFGDIEYITNGVLKDTLIIANYGDVNESVVTIPVDPITGLPAANPVKTVFATGASGNWGIAIDPITGNIWTIEYSNSILTQIAEDLIFSHSFE